MREETVLTADDSARLHMGSRRRPLTIMALLLLDRSPDMGAVVARVKERFAAHERFQQTVVESRFGLGLPRWNDVKPFDMQAHVHRVPLPKGHSLACLLADLARRAFDPGRPLWDLYVVPEVADGAAIILRIHHVLGDGIGLVQLLEHLSDEAVPSAHATRAPGVTTRGGAGAGMAARALLGATQLALSPSDPSTPFRVARGAEKQLAFSDALPLEKVTRAAHSHGGGIAGLLLTAVAGAVRHELKERGESTSLSRHALLPVPGDRGTSGEIGNHYGSVLVPLPVDAEARAVRAEQVAATLRALRSHGGAATGMALVGVAGAASASLEHLGVAFFSRKASATVSNVRGPSHLLHLVGSEIRDIVAWAPAPGAIGLSVTLLSYATRVRLGVSYESAHTGDARRFVQRLEDEFSELGSCGPDIHL